MKINKTVVVTAVVTASITCLLTNTVRDYNYIKNNGKIVKKLAAVTKIIKDNSIYQPDEDFMADLAASALAYSVEDKYTQYFDKDAFKQYIDQTSSSYFGVGITLKTDYTTGIVSISECTENGPSARAGVAVGDVLVGVDDKECNAQTVNEVISYIKSKAEGENVTLKLERNGESLEISVPLEHIQSVLVSGQMLNDEIAYIKIDNFHGSLDKDARTAYDDFMDQINSLRDSGMKKLVLDLRDNPGGDFGVVASIADEFLSEGLITYTEDKNGKQSHLYAKQGGLDYPVAVITNGKSASASEVLTGALKDNGKATVVGEKTYGKGVVQQTYTLSDGSGITVTVSRYFTPSGVCIHDVGIEPDVECKLPEGKTPADYTIETDPQIAKAVEVLANK